MIGSVIIFYILNFKGVHDLEKVKNLWPLILVDVSRVLYVVFSDCFVFFLISLAFNYYLQEITLNIENYYYFRFFL